MLLTRSQFRCEPLESSGIGIGYIGNANMSGILIKGNGQFGTQNRVWTAKGMRTCLVLLSICGVFYSLDREVFTI